MLTEGPDAVSSPDNAKAYHSHLWRDTCSELGIARRYTRSYSPWTNGKAEALIKTLECPRFRGHLSAWSALSDLAGRMRHHAKRIELPEAVPAGVSA